MMKSNKVLAGDSENEFDVDEPEEMGDHSEDEWDPTALAKTPARKKTEPKISYDKHEEEKQCKKEKGSKTKPPPPAPIPSSSRGRQRATKVLKVDPEEYSEDDEEFEEEGDEEEVGDDSEDEWAPTAVAKTPGKILRPAKSTPARKKKEPKVSYVEEIPPKKEKGLKAKPPPPAPIPSSSRGRGRATKVLIVEPEEDSEDDEEDEDIAEYEEEGEEEDDDYLEEEEEEEELNQGPNAKPAQKFTAGAFVICKTDMIDGTNPYIWKIDGELLLQRYIPFEQDGKVLYKSDNRYRRRNSYFKDQYYSAPVSFIKHTNKEYIIEFYKDKIKTDPIVEELEEEEDDVDVEEEEEAKLADDDEKE